jgi:hypothetical protein
MSVPTAIAPSTVVGAPVGAVTAALVVLAALLSSLLVSAMAPHTAVATTAAMTMGSRSARTAFDVTERHRLRTGTDLSDRA